MRVLSARSGLTRPLAMTRLISRCHAMARLIPATIPRPLATIAMSYEFVQTLSSQRREVDFYKSGLQIDVYKSGPQISVLATDRHGDRCITTVGIPSNAR